MNDNWMTIEWQLNDNWMTTEWQLNDNWMTTEWQLNDNWMTTEWQLNDNWMTIELLWMTMNDHKPETINWKLFWTVNNILFVNSYFVKNNKQQTEIMLKSEIHS